MFRFGLPSAIALFGVVACSSSSSSSSSTEETTASGPPVKTAAYVGFDANKLCDLLVNQCATPGQKLTMDECLKNVPLVVVPPECKAAFDTATCTTANQGLVDTCFPACDAATVKPACDGTNIQICANNLMYTYPCDKVCTAAGAVFTGRCASTYGDQVSPTDKCFCVH